MGAQVSNSSLTFLLQRRAHPCLVVTRSSAMQQGRVLGDQVIGDATSADGDHQIEVVVGAMREPSSDQVDDDEICLAY